MNMEKLTTLCNHCKKSFEYYKLSEKASNDSYKKLYLDMKKMPSNTCLSCKNERQRERRSKNGNNDTKKYEKTKKGFLMRTYRNMKSRISGVQKDKSHLYFGKFLCGKEFFYKWSLENENFHNLFDSWGKSKYCRKLTPSIDRIDSSKGYEKGNMRWLTHSENSRLGNISRYSK